MHCGSQIEKFRSFRVGRLISRLLDAATLLYICCLLVLFFVVWCHHFALYLLFIGAIFCCLMPPLCAIFTIYWHHFLQLDDATLRYICYLLVLFSAAWCRHFALYSLFIGAIFCCFMPPLWAIFAIYWRYLLLLDAATLSYIRHLVALFLQALPNSRT